MSTETAIIFTNEYRNLSDELCREHGLSVIIPAGQKGMTHYEWQMAKVGTSWKAQMKSDMDNAIREAHSYKDFIGRMQTKGYEVKGETFGDNALKYLLFCALGQSRFTRVSEKISVWDIRKKQSEGGSVEELERKIPEKNATAKMARSEIVDLEHEMKAKAEILKYAKQYMANRKYQRGYERAKDQDAYFRSHETQIILFGGAENMLKRYGIRQLRWMWKRCRRNMMQWQCKKQS